MSTLFDITTLTFNQWLLVSVIVIASVLLIFWVLALILSNNFRRSVMTVYENFNELTREEQRALENQELYDIWAGRIIDLGYYLTGKGSKRIGRQHLLSVLLWIFIFISIAGYFSGIYVQDFWRVCFLGIILITFMYTKWLSVLVRQDTGPDKNR